MARTVWNSSDPFANIAVSVVTSDVIDVRDAFDVMISWRTTSGLTSRCTLQMYVAEAGVPAVFVEGRWSNWTKFGETTSTPASLSSLIIPPLGIGHIRILRQVAGAPSQTSFDIHVARQVR